VARDGGKNHSSEPSLYGRFGTGAFECGQEQQTVSSGEMDGGIIIHYNFGNPLSAGA
jgi:hypothetical protein